MLIAAEEAEITEYGFPEYQFFKKRNQIKFQFQNKKNLKNLCV